MRVIKFRQWLKSTKQFHYFEFKAGICESVVSAALDECPITQFTGLKDKNEKEIYEGDVIIYRNNTGDIIEKIIIEQMQFDWGMSDLCIYGWVFGSRENDPSQSEVTGNIFENPELLDSDTEEADNEN